MAPPLGWLPYLPRPVRLAVARLTRRSLGRSLRANATRVRLCCGFCCRRPAKAAASNLICLYKNGWPLVSPNTS